MVIISSSRMAKVFFVLVVFSATCSACHDRITVGHPKVDRIHEITELPIRSVNGETMDVSWACGDELFWEIVAEGQEVIPYLIAKVKDITPTNIQIPCQDNSITEGVIAFMLLDEIVPIMLMQVFSMQFDVFDLHCDFGYPANFLDFVIADQNYISNRLTSHLLQGQAKLESNEIPLELRTECQQAFGISHVYQLR